MNNQAEYIDTGIDSLTKSNLPCDFYLCFILSLSPSTIEKKLAFDSIIIIYDCLGWMRFK